MQFLVNKKLDKIIGDCEPGYIYGSVTPLPYYITNTDFNLQTI